MYHLRGRSTPPKGFSHYLTLGLLQYSDLWSSDSPSSSLEPSDVTVDAGLQPVESMTIVPLAIKPCVCAECGLAGDEGVKGAKSPGANQPLEVTATLRETCGHYPIQELAHLFRSKLSLKPLTARS